MNKILKYFFTIRMSYFEYLALFFISVNVFSGGSYWNFLWCLPVGIMQSIMDSYLGVNHDED